MSRTIAVITGTRAEYGLLSGITRELREQGATIQLIVTGAHLSAAHGMTQNDINEPIAAKVDMQLSGDSPLHIAQATARATAGIAEALANLKPNMVVILGDRYEMLAAATSAFMLHIPIAHIHGGEVTQGAIDESIRHAITKLSYWHFAAAAPYAKRIAQLGEDPARIFTMGAPGIDNIAAPSLSKAQLEKDLGFALTSPCALFTYHPETLSPQTVEQQTDIIIKALAVHPDIRWLITGANADSGGIYINTALQDFATKSPNIHFIMSLGAKRYASAMHAVDVVVGNSSSALIEAPAIGKPAVNIGDRQKGRLRAPTVFDCDCDTNAIAHTLKKALSQAPFPPSTLFGTPGHICADIAQKLITLPLPSAIIKSFNDQ